MKEGILKTDSDFLGVMFKGVGPDFDSTFIHQNMIEGSIPKFDDKASHNQILISQLMADKLKLKTGERIFAYFLMTTECVCAASPSRVSIRPT